MMTIQELRPQYEFESPDADIVLMAKEPATISVGEEKYTGEGKAVLHVGRKPRIKVTMPFEFADVKDSLCKIFDQNALEGEVALTLNDRHLTIDNGYICNLGGGTISVDPEANKPSVISWESLRQPFIVRGDKSTKIDYLAFHLINCPELSSPNDKEMMKNGGWHAISIITLRWKKWVIEFKSIAKTSDNIKQVGESGGFGLTHIGVIRKEDNSSFEVNDIELLRMGFSRFMDFVVGRTCWPSLCIGYRKGGKVYEDWGTAFSDWYSPMTWATGNVMACKASETIETLFPLFMGLFSQEQTNTALIECISWYINTTEPGRPLIDQTLIFLQAGIERLSYEYAVNRKKLIHKTGFKDLRASDRFRLLFSSLGISLDIPSTLGKVTNLAETLNWEDVPHCLTEIRNAIVHPEHKKKDQIKDVYYDAWRLAIEYLELSILGFCGYAKQYYSRINEQNINVPWT